MANSFSLQNSLVNIGDTISMTYKLKEENKERQQVFSGILLKIRGTGSNKMFTLRKISRSGVGVERIIPLNSPNLVKIKVLKKANSRRSKLYFIRDLSEQEIKHKIYRKK